jgi:uncharacterized damage-inducible protein DinB
LSINEALLELYRHKSWATLRLVEGCQSLSDEQLDLTTPGTYGTIRETLHHLVVADEGYLAAVTGERVAEPEGILPLEELAARFRKAAPRWEALAQDADVASREVALGDGWRTIAAIPMAQAVHHADDHRAHVLSVIGAHGIEIPGLDIGEDLDVWHHGVAVGLMYEIPPTAEEPA